MCQLEKSDMIYWPARGEVLSFLYFRAYWAISKLEMLWLHVVSTPKNPRGVKNSKVDLAVA